MRKPVGLKGREGGNEVVELGGGDGSLRDTGHWKEASASSFVETKRRARGQGRQESPRER